MSVILTPYSENNFSLWFLQYLKKYLQRLFKRLSCGFCFGSQIVSYFHDSRKAYYLKCGECDHIHLTFDPTSDHGPLAIWQEQFSYIFHVVAWPYDWMLFLLKAYVLHAHIYHFSTNMVPEPVLKKPPQKLKNDYIKY